jgi:glycine/D-amino acid oxidase-like deaminating enzyme
MSVREHNFWLTTVKIPETDPLRPLPEVVDVAVIGAGFTGLSAARTLAKRGATVAVLETEIVGWGASSRNGGMVLTGLKLGVNKLIAMYGRERTQRMYAASVASMDCVEQLVHEENIDCNFSRCGHLEVACKQKHFDDYARQVEVIAREFNHQLRIVPRNELQSEIGSSIYYGGMVDEGSAGLNPARYVAGLAGSAAKSGAAIFEQTRVKRIEREARQGGAQGWRVTTSRGTLRARDVFAGTSGYTGGATPALRKKIVPIGSYIITTEVLPEALARELSPRNRMIYDSKNYLYYYRLTPDNRILFGGRAAFFHDRRLSAATRCKGRIRLGRHARLCFRHHAARGADGWHLLRSGICRPRCRHGDVAGPEDGGADRRREAGESVCGYSFSGCTFGALQREALVPAVCRGLVQVSGLGELREPT